MQIAVSSCLLGERIRFDGGHKHNHFITDDLGAFTQFVPFCPEHLAFGTPRPTIRLVHEKDGIEVHPSKSDDNLTEELLATSNAELTRLKAAPIRGIIFKSKSPSCGLGSALVYRTNGYGAGSSWHLGLQSYW